MFELVVQLLIGHVRGSTGAHHLRSRPWTAIDRLSIIWKSNLTYKMKRSFFQATVVSILLYGCTTWTLTKRLEKKLDGNYTRMLRAILNRSWQQHPTRKQPYGHLPPITKTIQARRTRHLNYNGTLREKSSMINTYGRCLLFLTNPGKNNSQNSNGMATFLPLNKLSK